jgi:AraC family transcriptional regulator
MRAIQNAINLGLARTDFRDVLTGSRRINMKWRELEVDYAWLPPFHGHSSTRPNRIEVVFSSHDGVAIEQEGKVYDITAQPGGTYAVGADGTRLLRVREYSDTLEMYPSGVLLRAVAAERGLAALAIEPTLQDPEPKLFVRDPVFLSQAHLLRRACMGQLSLSDIEVSTLAHQLVWHIADTQNEPERTRTAKAHRLDHARLNRVCEFIEEKLIESIALDEIAAFAHLSPWHFARQFRAATGLAPYQYALTRRMELAKRLLMTTQRSVRDIACDIGFENQSHFRRQFRAHVGVLPGVLREATRSALSSERSPL